LPCPLTRDDSAYFMLKLSLQHQHRLDVLTRKAIEIQKQLCVFVVCDDHFKKINAVASVDVGFENNGSMTRAEIAVLEFPSLNVKEVAISRKATSFPYMPGPLSFRELPAVLSALGQLKQKSGLILCDGQGYAHPRRFGIACHLGVLTDISAIGVGKTRLIGTHNPLEDRKWTWQSLMDKDEVIGAVLRARRGIKSIYASIWHRMSLSTAVQHVLACTTSFKLPETTRIAHSYASTC